MLNLTPDSFSDGGAYADDGDAIVRAQEMVDQGADVIDIGGESTRPRGATYGAGYATLSPTEEIARISGAVRLLAREAIAFSIDTTKTEVARFALEHGARVVNDTSCGANPDLLCVAAEHRAGLVLMHNRGRGDVSADNVRYGDVVRDVISELASATERALSLGVDAHLIAWDPGLGFAKTPEQSLRLLAELPRIVEIGYPVFVGASRKSFLAVHVAQAGRVPDPSERLGASVAACVLAVQAGAHAVRVHDVRESAQALSLLRAMPSQRAHA